MSDSIQITEIIAFVSFRSDLSAEATGRGSRQPFSGLVDEPRRLIPTDSDLLLSTLEPFRCCPAARIRVYDLETSSGRLRGMLNGISETPAVIVAGERYFGLANCRVALQELSLAATHVTNADDTTRLQKGVK